MLSYVCTCGDTQLHTPITYLLLLMSTHTYLQWLYTLPNFDCGVALVGDKLLQSFILYGQDILCHMGLRILSLHPMQLLVLLAIHHR